jgi:hypothetical protein
MQLLPGDQRAALALSTLRPLKHEDIARVLGCSRSEVKALVFQARASLAASRTGRETPCAEIREQLARSPRGALRRTTVLRHLRECRDCSAFRRKLRHQRQIGALIMLLPPSADLKERAMELVFGAAAAGGVAGAGIGAAALGHKAGALLGATAVLGAAAGVAVHFSPHPGDRVREAQFARTATSVTGRPHHTRLGLPAGFGGSLDGARHAGQAAKDGEHRHDRRTARKHVRDERRTRGARAGGTGTPAPGSPPAPTTPEGPAVGVPQTPDASLPTPPAGHQSVTQVSPPAVPPVPASPPHVGVQAPQPPQSLPPLPRVAAG